MLRAARAEAIQQNLLKVSISGVDENGDARGERMIATRQFEPEDVVLLEKPIVTVQTFENDVVTCHCCNAWAGTLASQIRKQTGHEELIDLPSAVEVGMELDHWEECDAVTCIECGKAYCCEACREEDHNGSWGWLCQASGSWSQFVLSAREAGSEHYLLAARLMIHFVHSAASGACSLEQACSQLCEFAAGNWIEFVMEQGIAEAERPAYAEALQSQVAQLGETLQGVILAALGKSAPRWLERHGEDPLFRRMINPAGFLETIGRTRANAQSIVGCSLLVPYVTAWAGSSGVRQEALGATVEWLRERAGVEEGGEIGLDDILPASQALGVCLVQSSANHSCMPNACATYPDTSSHDRVTGGAVQLQACRTIMPGAANSNPNRRYTHTRS